MMNRNLMRIFFSFFAFSASAFQFDHSVKDCDKTELQKNADALIQSVNIIYQYDENGNLIEQDPRDTLKRAGKKVGLRADPSSNELVAASKNEAKILCMDQKEGEMGTSASIVDYRDILITTAHVFYGEDGTPRRPCYYQLLRPPFTKKLLPVGDNVYTYTKNPYHDRTHDIAIVRLPELITDSQPFKLDGNQNVRKVGERYINISAQQLGMEDRAKPTDIIVQSCSARNIFAASSKRSSVVYTDCSGTEGSCGAVNMTRVNGELHVTSIQIGSGWNSRNGQPYDYKFDPKTKSQSASLALAIDSEFVENVRIMSRDPKASTVQTASDQGDSKARSN